MAVNTVTKMVPDNSGYLRTSHKKMDDYQTTKVGGVTNILELQAEGKTAFSDWRDDFSPKATPLSRVPFPAIVLFHTARRLWTGSLNLGLALI